MNAILALEDGTFFVGRSFGAEGEQAGEMVFNTSMTGYQEVITDPSYAGQIIAMTYPHIGNYGVNTRDNESNRPRLRGFAIRELARHYSNWRATESVEAFLKRHGVMGIEGIDTRALTKHIRSKGAMRAVLSTVDDDPKKVVKKAVLSPGLVGMDLAEEVTCEAPYVFGAATEAAATEAAAAEVATTGSAAFAGPAPSASSYSAATPIFKVVAFDFGLKGNILRMLEQAGCHGIVVPARATAEHVLAERPDGVFLSNGPGDPAAVTYAVETIRSLLGKLPIFGICLGHQLLSLALGAKTFKLKFGHRGGNQPVMNLATGRVEITSQNHGFAVDPAAFEQHGPHGRVEVTHMNLNDKTVEGIRCADAAAFSVQYHPEAAPGPHDSAYLFDEFIGVMSRHVGVVTLPQSQDAGGADG